jgi:hypothetical protein
VSSTGPKALLKPPPFASKSAFPATSYFVGAFGICRGERFQNRPLGLPQPFPPVLDGNGIEVSFELPPSKWPPNEQIFAHDILTLGRFPRPLGC